MTADQPTHERTPKLSVFMITYNHERFIREAIDSALMQQTDFPFEIVIGEDCSTDATRALVQDYAQRYPDRIRLLLHPHNVGSMRNFAQTYAACRGEYVAWLEGDDYWTAPRKLQQQVDFLDEHPDYALCFHQVVAVDDAAPDRPPQLITNDLPLVVPFEQLLRSNFIQSCSVVYRRAQVPTIPAWVLDLPMGDWPLHVLHAQHGKIGQIKQIMAVYRVHSGGVWSGAQRINRLLGSMQFYECINKYFDYRYAAVVQPRLTHYEYRLAEAYERMGDLGQARRYALRYWRHGPLRAHWSLRDPALFMGVFFPRLKRFLRRLRALV